MTQVKHGGWGERLWMTLALGLATWTSGCADRGSNGPAPQQPVGSTITMFTGTTDPLLLRADFTDGRQVHYFGTRDATGVPDSVHTISVLDATQDQTMVELWSDNRPKTITASDGVRFDFQWLGPQQATVTATSANGQTQVLTNVDFSQPPPPMPLQMRQSGGAAPVAHRQTPPYRAPRGGRPASLRARPAAMGSPPAGAAAAIALPATTGTHGQVRVQVTSCGVLSTTGNHEVFVTVRDLSNNELVGTFRAPHVGGGVFQTTIPTGQAEMPTTLAACQAIAGTLGNLCTAIEPLGPAAPLTICSRLAIAIDLLLGGPSGEGAAILAACLRAMPAVITYCETLGSSGPLPPGTPVPTAGEMLCEQIFESRPVPAQLQIVGWVNALPAPVYSPSQVVSAETGPFPVDLQVDLSDEPTIRTLTLSPANPAEGQDYVATADVFCLPAGTVVTMSIIGTDGYTDTQIFNISQTQTSGQFDLHVPGAQSGVRDTVTTDVVTPSGQTATKTAYLVFGS